MKRSLEDIAMDIETLGFFASAITRIDDVVKGDTLANAGFYIQRKLDELAKELTEVSE